MSENATKGSGEHQALPQFQVSTSYLDVGFRNVNKLLTLGSSVDALGEEHLGKIPHECSFEYCEQELDKSWTEELKLPKEQRSLWRPLLKLCGNWTVVLSYIFYGTSIACNFGVPELTNSITKHQSGLEPVKPWVYHLMIALIFIIPAFGALLRNRAEFMADIFACKISNALTAKIYKKCLSMNPTAGHSSGDLTALYTTDIFMIKGFLIVIAQAVFAPIEIMICLGLIYREVGVSMFAGMGVVFGAGPILAITVSFFMRYMMASRAVFQDRIKSTTDLLNGIKMIKYYAWEKPFFNLVNEVREKELDLLWKMYKAFIPYNLVLEGFPNVMPIVIFYVYIQRGNQLTFGKAFTVIMLLALLKGPVQALGSVTSQIGSAMVSKGKVLKFLNEDDMIDYVITKQEDLTDEKAVEMKVDKDTAVCFHNANFGWTSLEQVKAKSKPAETAPPTPAKVSNAAEEKTVTSSETEKLNETSNTELEASKVTESDDVNGMRSVNTLMDINLTIKKGQLLAITGPVGSGKSSMLSSLLNRLILKSGSVYMSGSQAYHCQQPWIMNCTVKDNILFGRECNEDVLSRILDVCTLTSDLKTLQAGIMTEIGEKGINLSGGQKARISFARALYRDADIYILDDPLSAVDAAVGSKMFNDGIMKYLIGQGKTVILATHQVHLLASCKDIICLDEGRIVARGDFASVKEHLVHGEEIIEENSEDNSSSDAQDTPVRRASVDRGRSRTLSKNSTSQKEEQVDKKDGQLIEEEERLKGGIKASCYKFFFTSGLPIAFGLSLSFVAGTAIMNTFADFLIKDWGEAEVHSWLTKWRGLSESESMKYLYKYCWLLMIGVGFQAVKSIFGIYHARETQLNFHNWLLLRVLGAPLAFFDTTPLGRIITRFSSDLEQAKWVHFIFWALALGFFQLICAVVTIAINTNGTFLLLLFPMSFIYYYLFIRFSKVTTDLRKIQNLVKSPININFSQTLSGIETIKSYGESRRFFERIGAACNAGSTADLASTQTNKWLMLRLSLLGFFVTFAITLLTSLTLKKNFIKPESLHLAVVYSQQLPGTFMFLLFCAANMESSMTTIERLQFYIENINKEIDFVINGAKIMRNPQDDVAADSVDTEQLQIEMKSLDKKAVEIPESWPSKGVIKFENLHMSYRDGPMVLKGVDFETKSMEKVGIVGRTGSGKSTIMTALFHFEKFRGGKITIDDIDLMDVPLDTLRDRICIILQEPIMFVSTVRNNLDPFKKFTDEQIWEVLDLINMKSTIEALNGKLSEPVLEGGGNFSVGQRQLICFARALLRKPTVLIMDEATASVDNETDALIQKMIRNEFKNSTVLTIAHRLNTIIDSDKILVLADGKVAEFDAPQTLLQKPEGNFRKMYDSFMAEHK